MPAALVVVALLYPLWVKRKKDESILQTCKDDLNTDYDHFKKRDNVYNKDKDNEFLHLLWFTDSYQRVLLDAPSQKKFDRDKIRTLLEKMKQDNKLFYKIDALPSKKMQTVSESDKKNKQPKKEIWYERRHDYQETIKELVCDMLGKEKL